MLVLEKQEKYDGLQQFFAIVQLIGTRKQADNFAYRYVLKLRCISLTHALIILDWNWAVTVDG